METQNEKTINTVEAAMRPKTLIDEILDQSAHWSMGQIEIAAGKVHRSGIAKAKKPEEIEVLMLIAQARGIHEIDAIMQFDLIPDQDGNPRPAMRAAAMQARFQLAGGRIKWQTHVDDGIRAAVKVWHPIHHPVETIEEITLESLEKRGVACTWKDSRQVLKKNYRENAPAMLRARLTSGVVRMILPGLVNGVYTPEEIADMNDVDDTPVTESILARAEASQSRLEQAIGLTSAPEPAPGPTPESEPGPPSLLERCSTTKPAQIPTLLRECAEAQDREAAVALLTGTLAALQRLPEAKYAATRERYAAGWAPHIALVDHQPLLLESLGLKQPAPAPVVADEDDDIPFEAPSAAAEPVKPEPAKPKTPAEKILAAIADAGSDTAAVSRAELDFQHNLRGMSAEEKRAIMTALKTARGK